MEMLPGLSDQEKRELCQSLNEHRRQMNAEDRKDLARQMRAEGASTRAIADRLGTSEATVRNDLSGVQNCAPDVVTGRDGKSYPATRPTSIRLESPEEATVASVLLEEVAGRATPAKNV